MIRIRFCNTCDIDNILFSTGFKPTLYLNQELGYPQFVIDKEIQKDGELNDIALFEKWQKRYSVIILADEPTLDGLTVMQICDNVWITNPVTNVEWKVKDVVFEQINWNDDGLATVKINFAVDELTKTNCCDNLEENCEDCTVRISTFTYVSGDDFNMTVSTTCTEGQAALYYQLDGSGTWVLIDYYDITDLADLDFQIFEPGGHYIEIKLEVGKIDCLITETDDIDLRVP